MKQFAVTQTQTVVETWYIDASSERWARIKFEILQDRAELGEAQESRITDEKIDYVRELA